MSPVDQNKFRIFRYSFWLVLIFFLTCWAFLLIYQKILQSQTRQRIGIETEEGIDSLFSIELGEVEQWLLIRGEDRLNPLMLVLHGGPGAPLFPFARDLGWYTGLENHFTLIYWEQRGTGKSYHNNILPQSMTLQQINADLLELVQYIRENFQFKKIYLLARSWGSLAGITVVSQNPDWFYAYISIGQMIIPLKSDSISFEYTRKLATVQTNINALSELEDIGYPPYDYQKILLQRKWLSRLRKNQEQSSDSRPSDKFFQYFRKLLATPEYSLWDILSMGSDPHFSLKHLWNNELYQINLLQDLLMIEVPVYFICGRTDYITSGLLVEEYYAKLQAPLGKYVFWFEKSGHQPEYTEPNKFYDILVNHVLPDTYHP